MTLLPGGASWSFRSIRLLARSRRCRTCCRLSNRLPRSRRTTIMIGISISAEAFAGEERVVRLTFLRQACQRRPSVPVALAFAFRERKPWRGAARGTGTAPGRFPNLRLTKP